MKPDEETDAGAEEIRRCHGCGAEIKGSTALGHCPRCLVELGFSQAPGNSMAQADKRVFKPRQFGDYELLEQIGRGGMGVVYRARQISLNRTVALKMVLDSQISSPLALRRFEIEAEAAARLEHPHIVSIFEIGSEEEQPFISMRFIEGESLAQKLVRGEFRPSPETGTKAKWTQVQERIAHLMATVARAVHYAHQHGVIHRDIKPGNILIDAEGQPHLTDFSLAMLTDTDHRLSQTGALIGTLSYLAPEQATGGTASVATDIYSLGAVLYELLTGDVPFDAPTPMETLRMVTEQPSPRPSVGNKGIDRDLETICLKCLEKDPSGRYGSAQALAEDLERWRRRETILARPVGPIHRLGRWGRRNPVGAALILSLFVGLLISLCLVRILHVRERAQRLGQLRFERTREIIFEANGMSDFWEKIDKDIRIKSEILAEAIDAERNTEPKGKIGRFLEAMGVSNIFRKSEADPPASSLRAAESNDAEGRNQTPGTPKRFRIGMHLEEDPAAVVIGYARITGHLERKLRESLGYTVLFDLQLYHDKHKAGTTALVEHRVDFLKIGGASYLDASKSDAGIRPLIGQNPAKNGFIFARKNSGIANARELAGKSVAIKSTSSSVSMRGVSHLLKLNIPALNFVTLGSAKPQFASDQLRQVSGGRQVTFASPIIEAVLEAKADAGIETETVYKGHERSVDELVVLETFSSSRVFWLAASSVPREIAQAFTKTMVELRDPRVFSGLVDKVTSYSEVTNSELEELRKDAASVQVKAPKGE